MDDHKKLFKHFGKERWFSMDEAMIFLALDPDKDGTKFAYGPRTMARRHARRDLQGYYLACPHNDRYRMIFTRNPELIVKQFRKDRATHRGSKDTLIELVSIAIEVGATDGIDFPQWLKLYEVEQHMEQKLLDIEAREAALAAA